MLLGIDIGTTGCKAIVFNEEGRMLASSYREYPLSYTVPGWIELDANLVWTKTKDAIKEVSNKVAKKDRIKSLSVSCLGEAVIPIGKNGQVLSGSIVGFDARGKEAVEFFDREIGKKKIFKITGQPLNNTFSINKILWWRDNRKDVFKKAWKFLCYEDFAYFRMGLPPTIDYSLASRTMAFDLHKKDWSETILKTSKINHEMLPTVKPSGEIVGEIPSSVANELGLPQGVVAVTGGHDQPCGALGAGVIKENIAMDATGTVECIAVSFRKPILTEKMLKNNFCCYPHVVKDFYITLAYNFTGGSLLRWFRDNFGQKELELAKKTGKDAYEILIAEAKKEPTDLLILPHFATSGTPYFDPKSTGAILGLSLETEKKDLIKAILEGITWEMKFNLKLLEKAGIKVKELRAIGGGAKSSQWLQLKADMFNKKVLSLNVSEAACSGTAILAGVAIGQFKSINEAVKIFVKSTGIYKPDVKIANIYEKKFQTYAKIYPAIKDIL